MLPVPLLAVCASVWLTESDSSPGTRAVLPCRPLLYSIRKLVSNLVLQGGEALTARRGPPRAQPPLRSLAVTAEEIELIELGGAY